MENPQDKQIQVARNDSVVLQRRKTPKTLNHVVQKLKKEEQEQEQERGFRYSLSTTPKRRTSSPNLFRTAMNSRTGRKLQTATHKQASKQRNPMAKPIL
jgi:hypothetical protein